MIHRRSFLKGLFAAVPLGAAAVIAGKKKAGLDPVSSPEAFRLDLEKFRHVDPALKGYTEQAIVVDGVEGASAMALSLEGGLYVALEDKVLRLAGGDLETAAETGKKVTAVALCKKNTVWTATGSVLSGYDSSGQLAMEPVHLGERAYITSLAVEGNRVFAADAGQRVVWIISTDGKLVGQIDGRPEGKQEAGFVVPSPWFSIAAVAGHLWVTNPGRQRVERYVNGRCTGSWGFASMDAGGFCGCCNPTHLALLPGGGFVTSEKGIPRVKVYNAHGDLQSIVAGADDFNEGTTGLALAVNSDGRILVLDPVRGQVRTFARRVRGIEA